MRKAEFEILSVTDRASAGKVCRAQFLFCSFSPQVCKCLRLRFSFWPSVPKMTVLSQYRNQVYHNNLGNSYRMIPTPQLMETILVTGDRVALMDPSVCEAPP